MALRAGVVGVVVAAVVGVVAAGAAGGGAGGPAPRPGAPPASWRRRGLGGRSCRVGRRRGRVGLEEAHARVEAAERLAAAGPVEPAGGSPELDRVAEGAMRRSGSATASARSWRPSTEAERAARELEEALARCRGRREAPEPLREELDRLGGDREADLSGFKRAMQALRQELDLSRSREAAERERAAALSEALVEVERRLEEADAVGPPVGLACRAGRDRPFAQSGRRGDDGPAAGQARGSDPAGCRVAPVESRLCSLLNVFGLPERGLLRAGGAGIPPGR